MTDIYIHIYIHNVSMGTYSISFSLSHTYTLACWKLQRGERNRLTFYREEKNGGER